MIEFEALDKDGVAATVTDIGIVASFYQLKGGDYIIHNRQKNEMERTTNRDEAYFKILDIAGKALENEIAKKLTPAIEHQHYPLLNKAQRKAIAQKKGLLNIVREEVKEELRAEMEKRCRTPTPHLNALRRMGG